MKYGMWKYAQGNYFSMFKVSAKSGKSRGKVGEFTLFPEKSEKSLGISVKGQGISGKSRNLFLGIVN